MTFIRSFFNKAVYKATVKRFLWGSVLYFVLLFLSTNLILMLAGNDYSWNYLETNFYYATDLNIFPTVLAMAVPTVVALLVWRFLHSKKQSLFIHSQPVTRGANYVSTLLAAFTLMAVPVLLNGVILGVTVASIRASLFSLPALLVFIGIALLSMFLFFSVATFSAMLTGNSFAVVVINVLIHGALFFFLFAGEGIAEAYLYGYSSGSEVLNNIMYSNFLSLGANMMESTPWSGELIRQVLISTLFAVFFYVASYFLYRKRKVEEVGSVAGFRILNGIFKYGVTLLVTMITTAIFAQNNNLATFPAVLFVTIVSVVVYLGTEMVLKKSVHVLGSLKGFFVFALLFAGAILIFSQTSFFGYETRIPAAEDVESVTFYEYYYTPEEPFFDNPEIISKVIEKHGELITPERLAEENRKYYEPNTRVHIKYKLKDGSLMERAYGVGKSVCDGMLTELYHIEDYKKKMEILLDDSLDVVRIYLEWQQDDRILEEDELLQAFREDLMEKEYREIHADSHIYYPILDVEIMMKDNNNYTWLHHETVRLNQHYEKTISWLLEKGYIYETSKGYETTFGLSEELVAN